MSGEEKIFQKNAIFFSGLTALLIAVDIYHGGYDFFYQNGLYHDLLIKAMLHMENQGVFSNPLIFKLAAFASILALALSENTKKDIKAKPGKYVIAGMFSPVLLFLPFYLNFSGLIYILFTLSGYIGLGYAISGMRKILRANYLTDRFDEENRRFIQEKKKIVNKYSVNFKTKHGYINVINPFRASIVLGTPGSGKSYAILEEVIRQNIMKGFTLCVYDFKMPALTEITYNYLLKYGHRYEIAPKFYVINFDDPERSHRCNPLQPDLLIDFVDAVEASQTIMNALNKTWIRKQGDFFVESPVNFFAMCIWALKLLTEKLNSGTNYCTFPHAIEFVSLDYDTMFAVLGAIQDPSIDNILAPFRSAYENQAIDQLEGQIASVRLGLARLTSPVLYWVMTGQDFSLDINSPANPKILCLGNNIDRQKIYGCALSLYSTKLISLVNKKKKHPCSLIWDELPTLFLGTGTLDNLIATGRSNKIAVWLGFQDYSQIIRDYGKEVAEAILNTPGNLFSGAVNGESAKKLAESFGKYKVRRTSVSVSKRESGSYSLSEQMEELIPASVITNLSQGDFVGRVADNFDQKLKQKTFYSTIIDDKSDLGNEPLPILTEFPTDENGKSLKDKIIQQQFLKVRSDIKKLAASVMANVDLNI